MCRRPTIILALCVLPSLSVAQYPAGDSSSLRRSGPRFGLTVLSASITREVREKYDRGIASVITQFGWQFEQQFRTVPEGPVALTEFVILVGGTEQGWFIPSATWLVGMRTPGNFEIGVGPNASPLGVAMAFSLGQTFWSGELAMPLNIGVVSSRSGTRVSLLTGFNLGVRR